MGFLLSTLLFLQTFLSANAQDCTTHSEKKLEMPPLKSQDSTGFCYGFAATSVLQYHYCKTKPIKCKYPDDQLSALDLITQGNHGDGGLLHGGDPEKMLQAVSTSKNISLDSCAPFDQILNSEKIWKSTIKSSKENFDKCPEERRGQIAAHLKSQLQLKTTAEQIKYALGYRDLSIMSSKIFIPDECQNKKVTLPSFVSKSLRVLNFPDYKSKIIELLNKKTPAIISICGVTLTNSSHSCSDRLHALVIDGVRQKCCGNTCKLEFHVHDSAKPNTFSKNEISPDDWISEDTLQNRFSNHNKLPMSGNNLVWIE